MRHESGQSFSILHSQLSIDEDGGVVEMRAGYKQTEVGMIPEDWDVTPLSRIPCEVVDCHHSTPAWTQSGVVVIRNQNIRNGKLLLAESSYTDETHYRERVRRATPSNGDLVITREAPMGQVCMIPSGLRCCLGQRMVLLRVSRDSADSSYVLYALQAEPIQRFIAIAGGTGSTVSNLRIPVIRSLPIPAPSWPEQRAIAVALSDVDALLDGLDRLIGKKRDLKQAAMQQLLTGQTRLPVFQGEWEVKELRELCSMKSGEAITSANFDAFSKYPCYGGNGLRGHASRFTHDGRFALVGRQGALCGNVVGVEGKFFASEHAVVVTPSLLTDVRWLTYVLARLKLNRYSESSAQPGLSVSKIMMLDVFAPPTKAEQEAIASVLSDMDAELSALEARRDKTRALKQGMMQELLTGRTRLVNG